MPARSLEMLRISRGSAQAVKAGTLMHMLLTKTNSAALRAGSARILAPITRSVQPCALVERISFAVQPMVSPAQAGAGAGAFAGGRSSHRST
jgi:hypothetical protein